MNSTHFLDNLTSYKLRGLYKNGSHFPWFSETQITFPDYFRLQIGKDDFQSLLNTVYLLGSEFGLVQQRLNEKGFLPLRSKEEAIDILLRQGFTEEDWQLMEMADKGFPPFMEGVETVHLDEYTHWYFDGANLFIIKEGEWVVNLPHSHPDYYLIDKAIQHQNQKDHNTLYAFNKLHETSIDELLASTYANTEMHFYFGVGINFLNQYSFERNKNFLIAILKAFNTQVKTDCEETNQESMIAAQDVDLFDMDELDEDWFKKL